MILTRMGFMVGIWSNSFEAGLCGIPLIFFGDIIRQIGGMSGL